jgi:hypothetical protein
MRTKERLKRLEEARAVKDYRYEIFVVEPGAEGRDEEGFTPEDRKRYEAANASENATIHVITVLERKPQIGNQRET